MTIEQKFEFAAGRGVSLEQVDRLIADVLAEAKTDPDAAGLTDAEAAERISVTSGRPNSQEAVAATIVIAIASRLAAEVTARLWNELLWPALKRRFGGDVKPL